MTTYINTTTMEYPRHAGDIAIDPTGTYAEVQWVDRPEFDTSTQACDEGTPENVDGVWRKTWVVRPITEQELALKQKFDALIEEGGDYLAKLRQAAK